VDPRGDVFVTDVGTHRLVRCGPNDSVSNIGGYGWSSSAFDQPLDVAAPNAIDVYVADYGNHRIQRFDRNLNFISSLSLRDSDDPDERFGYPKSVAVDRFGALFIVDGENTRIVKVNTTNSFDRTFGGITSGWGRLVKPVRVRVSDDDIVYVQDGNAIVAFDLFGNYIRKVGEGLFTSLRSIAVDGSLLYALDSCGVVRIAEKGTRFDRIDALRDCGTPCSDIVDFAIHDSSGWILTSTNVIHCRVNDTVDQKDK